MKRRSILGLALALPALLGIKAKAAPADDTPPKRYFVLMHRPGPAWVRGKSFRDQPGIGAHVGYMSGFLDQKKLVMGGPFLDDSGGMMLFDLPSIEAARAIAGADPTVKSGLLEVHVKPWQVAMSQD